MMERGLEECYTSIYLVYWRTWRGLVSSFAAISWDTMLAFCRGLLQLNIHSSMALGQLASKHALHLLFVPRRTIMIVQDSLSL